MMHDMFAYIYFGALTECYLCVVSLSRRQPQVKREPDDPHRKYYRIDRLVTTYAC